MLSETRLSTKFYALTVVDKSKIELIKSADTMRRMHTMEAGR